MVVLPIAIPLVGACVLVAGGRRAPRWLTDLLATGTAAATAVISIVLAARAGAEHPATWSAGWHPRNGVPVGIAVVGDRAAAGLAGFTGLLVTAAFVFAWRYYDTVQALFHGVMLTFLAGMNGVCLSGDLFDIFVFYELMSVSAFALTAYKVEERGPIQGSLNFAVTNTIGALFTLLGIGLLYGRTGALNLAAVGESVTRGPLDGLVVAAFVLVNVGFLVKAAVVPFHMWLPDAHAVAPIPVCVLLSGVMVELGLYVVARFDWVLFARLGYSIGDIEVVAGVVTATVGGVLCVAQHHLKRLLAFSTVSHVGVMLTGLGAHSPDGLAAAGVYLVGHGLVKGTLFLCAGIVLHRCGTVDEHDAHGRARAYPAVGGVFALAGLALAGLPPFATFTGKSLLDDALASAGYHWVPAVLIATTALTGGAVLRYGARAWLGLGRPAPPESSPAVETDVTEEEERETVPTRRTPVIMVAPAVALIGTALALGMSPMATDVVGAAAAGIADGSGYRAAVLQGVAVAAPATAIHVPLSAVVPALATVGLALVIAAVAVTAPARAPVAFERPLALLRAWHSGVVDDEVTWLVVGVAALGATASLLL